MSNQISIFDIPLIMEHVGFYLDRRDRATCTLVNKTFYAHFVRLVWNELMLTQLISEQDAEVTPEHRQAMLDNGQWVRRLEIDTGCRRTMSSLLSLTCKSLRALTVFIDEDRGEAGSLPLIQLILSNSLLRSLSLGSYAKLNYSTLQQLATALQTCHCITELNLGLAFRPHGRWLRQLLQSLPSSLSTLYLHLGRSIDHDGVMDTSGHSDSWPEAYPDLVAAEFHLEIDGDLERTIFCQFLERCTALRKLTVPLMSSIHAINDFIKLLERQSLPALKELDTGSIEDISEDQWIRLMTAMRGRIQHFNTSVKFDTVPAWDFIQELTTHWSGSLETLRIDRPSQIPSYDIQLILTNCFKLKSFHCLCPWVVMVHQQEVGGWDATPGLEVMIRSEDNNADWVCLDLEELKLTFADGRRVHSDTTLRASQSEWTREGIRRVYCQMGRLTKLKELTIGWNTGKTFASDVNLDMSLESGLGHLEGLKELRMIDFNYISKVNIGQDEVEWMFRNWPMLRNIKGLRYRRDLGCKDREEPGHIRWMRVKRPSIVIQ